MKNALFVVAALTALASCAPEQESETAAGNEPGASLQSLTGADFNLECAAMISAADRQGSNVKRTSGWTASKNDVLVGGMTHLNTYAIPAGLKEADAFKQLNTLRTEVMRDVSGAEIIERAKACLEEVGIG